MRIIFWRYFFLPVSVQRTIPSVAHVELLFFLVISAHPDVGIYDGLLPSHVWSPRSVRGAASGPTQARVVLGIGSTETLASL